MLFWFLEQASSELMRNQHLPGYSDKKTSTSSLPKDCGNINLSLCALRFFTLVIAPIKSAKKRRAALLSPAHWARRTRLTLSVSPLLLHHRPIETTKTTTMAAQFDAIELLLRYETPLIKDMENGDDVLEWVSAYVGSEQFQDAVDDFCEQHVDKFKILVTRGGPKADQLDAIEA